MSLIKVYRDFIPIHDRKPSAVTFGNFDGMHLGHQKLMQTLSEKKELQKVAILFDPLPEQWFNRKDFIRLMPLEDQIQFLETTGIDCVLCLSFNEVLANCSATNFMHDILHKMLQTQYLVLGGDARFGKGREGDVSLLRKNKNWQVQVLSNVDDRLGKRISSSRCRSSLLDGDIDHLKGLLGRNYLLSIVVHRSDKTVLGNELICREVTIPYSWTIARGVYGTTACFDGERVPIVFTSGEKNNQQKLCVFFHKEFDSYIAHSNSFRLILERSIMDVNFIRYFLRCDHSYLSHFAVFFA